MLDIIWLCKQLIIIVNIIKTIIYIIGIATVTWSHIAVYKLLVLDRNI